MRNKRDDVAGRKSLKLKRTGLHERAAARMRDMIIRGELEPGSSTQETRLSEALGVSRTPLREAMKLLAAEGLVELRPNRSPRIADIETDHVFELFEALAGIERLAALITALPANSCVENISGAILRATDEFGGVGIPPHDDRTLLVLRAIEDNGAGYSKLPVIY